MKPIGRVYGHIPHLPGSRLGSGDHHCHEGQARICLEHVRDRRDRVVVQEKVDGSCVAVALVDGKLLALGRAGYVSTTSPYEQHKLFAWWVRNNEDRFRAVLAPGERLVGEWLAQAHSTRYDISGGRDPFVAFDLMIGVSRITAEDLAARVLPGLFVTPKLIAVRQGEAVPLEFVLANLEPSGHGALDPVEGAVWRVERDVPREGFTVDFLAKYVRHDKTDGVYLPEVSGKAAVWNWNPWERRQGTAGHG